MHKQPTIGVLGGMGPLATLDLLHKILVETPALRDQDHVPTLTWNVPQIPDRQKALAGIGESPLSAMLDGISKLNAAGATRIAIPCNTAHFWFDELQAGSCVPIIHIADATMNALRKLEIVNPYVGLIATQGTLDARLYQDRLNTLNIPFVTNTEQEFSDLFTPGCYAIKQGQLDRGGRLLEAAAECLVQQGATILILACTEVPLGLAHIHSKFLEMSIDPTRALASECVAYWQEYRVREEA